MWISDRACTLFLLIANLMLLPTASSLAADTLIEIEYARINGDSVNLLISETHSKSTCPLFAHGCTFEDLGATLYQIQVPLSTEFIAKAKVVKQWQTVLSADNDNSFPAMEITQGYLIDIPKQDQVRLCKLQPEQGCEPIGSVFRDVKNPLKRYGLDQTGTVIYTNHQLYKIPNLETALKLMELPGYPEFIQQIKQQYKFTSTNRPRLSALGSPDKTTGIIAVPGYVDAAAPRLALLYDLKSGQTKAITGAFDRPGQTLAMLATYFTEDDTLFLIKLFDFEGSTQILEEFGVYSVNQQSLRLLTNFRYSPLYNLVWDQPGQRIIKVSWREGIKLESFSY